MHIIHGTWIPDEDEPRAPIQRGGFYLWVEGDTSAGHTSEPGEMIHPQSLGQPQLESFLVEKLGLAVPRGWSVVCARFFLLPTAGGAPLASEELLPYAVGVLPEESELAWWQVSCFQVPRLIGTLNQIHFAALHGAEGFQLGADLLFWYQLSQVLKGVILRDQYIPALKSLAPAPEKKRQRAKREQLALYPAWEMISDTYETALREYAAAMPAVCAAGAVKPQGTTLYARESLLRHFSENLLHDVVSSTPFTAKLDQETASTFLYGCLNPDQTYLPDHAPASLLDTYQAWAAWREKLTTGHTAARFTVCFRLEEAPATDADNWQVHFLVAAKDDPSYKLPLQRYWGLRGKDRADVTRRFGKDFEKELLLALGAAARIYPRVWEGLETVEPTSFQLSLTDAFAFLKEDAWALEDAGYTVMVPSWWTPQGRRRAKVRLKTSARPKKGAAASAPGRLSLDAVVGYDYQLSIGGEAVSEEEWRRLVASKEPLVQFRGHWMELDRDKMQQLLEFWHTHREKESELTMLDVMKLATEADDDLEWDHDEALSHMLARLQDKSALDVHEDPAELRGTLRAYQKRGLAWLGYLEDLGLNPCLADDMGLGKTVQVIARLVEERAANAVTGPTLLIAPTSVLSNWRRELQRFAPQLRTLVHQGSTRTKQEKAFQAACAQQDVVITSFALARLDEKLLRSMAWHRVVVDEAQNIKNPKSGQARAITKLSATHRLALTGTPVENRLLDLWSVFNFLHPGYLGTETQFRRTFETPIQRDHDVGRSSTLKKIVEPFILRRVKTDKRIIDDLPDKVEQKLYCNLTPEQASLYEAVVKDTTAQLESLEGIQRRGLMLATLLKLKQVCNHPAQFLHDGSPFTAERSFKLQRLQEMLEEAIESGDSALVFTQFTEIGESLEAHLRRTLHCATYYLHGGTSAARRDELVEAFQDPEGEPSVFVLSLRAGGVGLNLTRANHVFHFDRWWNPAVEDQATDRAFRIGQTKNVLVRKLMTVGTMEEHIDDLIEQKKHLSGEIVGADESWLAHLDNETFRDLIALQRSAVLD